MEEYYSKIKHTEGLRLLGMLYEHLMALPLFDPENVPRIFLFARGTEGKERPKSGRKGYVRRGFVEIGCLGLSRHAYGTEGVFNVNVQDEDIEWVEEVAEYLRDYIDCSVISGYHFSFVWKHPYRASSTLHFHNLRFSVTR